MLRRDFLQSIAAGMAVGTPAVSQPGLSQAGRPSPFMPDGYEAPDWLRYARTIYFDGYSPPLYPHFRDFDAKRLVECAIRLGGDTLRSQGIGYFAYFPTKHFPVHPELGGRDVIEEVSRECRRQGLHHYCYSPYQVYFTKVGWVEQHPEFAEWVRRGPDGKPFGESTHIGWQASQQLCILGDTYRQAVRNIVREYCQHDLDGVYLDAPSGYGYSGFCFCGSCRRNYKQHSGFEIDRLRNPDDLEARIAWYEWANRCTEEDLRDFRQIIHGSGKFMLCHNGGTWNGTSLRLQYRVPDGFMIEHANEIHQRLAHGMLGASMARPYRKLPQMYLGSYTNTDFNHPAHLRPWAVHNTNIEDGEEIRMEGFANLASGGAPLYSTANRIYFGAGGGSLEHVQDVFHLMRSCEEILKDGVPVPYVTVVPTWASLQRWRAGAKSWNWDMTQAFVLAMLDEHLNVDVCPDTELNADWLKSQRVIALCGASGVSGEQAGVLAAWVESGGSLLATYDTGLYDDKGRVRNDGGALRKVLGIEMTGEPLLPQPESYFRVRRGHPALGSNAEGALLPSDATLVPARPAAGATVLADCWNLGTGETRGPGIVLNQYGQGKVIFINGSLEAHYEAARTPCIGRLLGSVVRYLAGTAPPFELSSPTGVFGVLRQTRTHDLALWLLANVGFKDAAAGRMRQEFVPVMNVEIRILVPEGRRVRALHLARSGRALSFTMSGNYAVARIPVLQIAELVHVQLT